MKTVLTKNVKHVKSGQVTYWVLRWFDMAGHRRSQVVCKDDPSWYDKSGQFIKKWEKQFNKLVARVETDLAQKYKDVRPGAMTLKDFFDKYFELRKNEREETTLQRYMDTANYMRYHFGDDKKVDTIDPLAAAEFKAKLAAGELAAATKAERKRKVSSTSVIVHVRNAKAMFNYGRKVMKVISDNPFAEMSGSDKTATKWDYISKKDFLALFNAATPNFKALIALARLAGLRRMEAYYLEWNDINFDKNEICICDKPHWTPKDKELRYIPMCKELSAILTEAFHNAPEGAIRICPKTNPMNIDRAIAGTIKRAGLKFWKKPLHSLRKSCIQDWTETFPLTDVKCWAGHSSIDTTQRFYTQENKENRKRACTESLWISTENRTEQKKQECPKENADIYDYSI